MGLVFALIGCGDPPPTFSIATGGTSGLFYPFGGGMASIWSRELPDVNVKAEVTGGSVVNVIQVARHESEIAIATADVLTDAVRGEGLFSEALPLRVLFTAYPNYVHLVTLADRGIERITDLRGRRVSLGAAGSGTAVAAENILQELGIDLSTLAAVQLGFGDTVTALKDGTIDAGFLVGGAGIAAVTELAVSRDVRLVPLSTDELETLHARHPAYVASRISGGTYGGVDLDVPVVAIWAVVVVHEDMPAPLAESLVCTVYRHHEALGRIIPFATTLKPEYADELSSVPLHPGTRRYLARSDRSCEDEEGRDGAVRDDGGEDA